MAAFTTIALATIAAAGIASSVVQGNASRQAAFRGNLRQKEAKREAEAAAASQQAQNDMAYNAANAKKPNVGTLLSGEQDAALPGAASTILSKRKNPLASSSLLGG